MNSLRNFIPMVLAFLGIRDFAVRDGKKIITEPQKEVIKSYGFNDRFIEKFEEALNSGDTPEPGAEGTNARTAALSAALSMVNEQLTQRNQEIIALQTAANTTSADLAAKQREIDELKQKVAVLSELREGDPGAAAGRPAVSSVGEAFNLEDEAQLCGRQGEMFALDRPYNLRAKAAIYAARGYNMVVAAESSFDYSTLKADLGAFYRVPWIERLQSFLVRLPTVESIFPLKSGYQDLATLVNIWLGEFSQSDNTQSNFDNVVKGSYDFGTETLRMFDVMFAHKFTNLKELEKLWIGSLNKEGSDPIKWSFIEYILVETAKKLHNEREMRRINGVRKNPVLNVQGRALDAADGLYERLRKWVDGCIDTTPNGGTTGKIVYQIKPFPLPKITQANIGEVFYVGTSLVPSEMRDTGKIGLHVPSFMIPMYHKYLEVHYGANKDYKPGEMYVHEYPNVKLIPVPNADNHYRIFWTFEGNINCFEDKPGEMIKFNLEQQDWTLKVWSNWKESIWAMAVGYKYTDKSKMDGSRQLIWCNDYDRSDRYFIAADPDKNPSVNLHTSVITVENSQLLTITNIEDAKVGAAVSIMCGFDGAKGVKISKADKFSLISADWIPAKGDVITLMKRTDGKFIELGRVKAELADAFAFADDDTTPSVAGAVKFVTGANTEATAITDLDDATPGVVYTIYGNGSTYASTIANGGKFALTEPMTLSTGHYIQLVKAADGKFYEVARG